MQCADLHDGGRPISKLIFKQVAAVMTEQHHDDDAAELLPEEGIPPQRMSVPEGIAPGDVYAILSCTWQWRSEGRRIVRRFLAPVSGDHGFLTAGRGVI